MPYPSSYPNWVFSLFSFTGFLMVCIPFPWHFEAWNTGTCLYMGWIAIACLNQFINSIVWSGNAINWAPVWCDISAKIIVGTAVAVPAASLCINRRLYHIASVRAVTITKAEKRRAVMVDLAIGLGLPVLEMILQYIPQGHRFNIFEDVGCWPFTYDTWVAYLLVSVPPIVIGLVSAVYGVLSIRAFNETRTQSKKILSSYSNLTTGRYFRLMALAGIEILLTIPIGIYAIYLNAGDGQISPWISWEDTHSGFSRVDQVPAMMWRYDIVSESSLELSRWLCVVCAFVFFGFFGFADEARKHYRLAVSSVSKRLGTTTGSFGNSTGLNSSSDMSKGAISSQGAFNPGYGIEKFRRNSFDSFSDGTGNSLKDSFAGVFSSNQSKENFTVERQKNFDQVGKKKFNEEIFKPTFQYDNLELPDIGGTLADYAPEPESPVTSGSESSLSSSASSIITIPEPAATRDEMASIHRSSRISFPETSNAAAKDPHRNSHDMV